MWLYKGCEVSDKDIEGYYGFVYIITNLLDNKKYVGRKYLFSKKTKPPLKGTKKKRVEFIDSGWRDYWSSSPELLKEIETLGKENFKREIINFCINKQETNYHEVRLQIILDALDSPDFYNSNIMSKFYRTKRDDIKKSREFNMQLYLSLRNT